MAIRKATTADAQSIVAIFNGFVTRHQFGVKPSWTDEMVLRNIADPRQLTLVMDDGGVTAFFLLWIENGVARVQSAAWTLALESVRPDPQFTFSDWMADHQTEIGATEIEALWHTSNPFGALVMRAMAANLLRPTGGYVGKATQVTVEGDFVHMIATLDSFGKWYKERKPINWTRLYEE